MQAALAATGGDLEELERRNLRRTVAAGWIAAGAALGVALVEARDAAGGLRATDLADFLLSNRPGFARVMTVLAIAGAVVSVRRRPRLAATLTALTFAAIALRPRHAADPRPLSGRFQWNVYAPSARLLSIERERGCASRSSRRRASTALAPGGLRRALRDR